MKNYVNALLKAIKRRVYSEKPKPHLHVISEGLPASKSRSITLTNQQTETENYRHGTRRKRLGLHWYTSLFILSVRWYVGLLLCKKPNGELPGKRYSSERAILLKRRYITGIAALIIVTTMALSVSLFGHGNNVYASGTNSPQPQSTSSPDASDSPLSQPAVQTYEAYAAAEDMAKTWSQSDVSLKQVSADSSDTGLNPGYTDSRIIDIQSRLMDLGYMDSDQPTDYYGWSTKYAIELFQRKNGLQIDGLIGQQTMALLFADNAPAYTVTQGDYGSDVKAIQERLIELKYFSTDATGYYGNDTTAAVKSFQKTNGLTADGNIGEDTNDALFSEDAKAAPVKKSSTAKTTKTSTAKASGNSSSSPAPSSNNTAGSDTPDNPDQSMADKLISIAKSYLGCKYVRGGKGSNIFDCSGFVYYCLNKAGYKIDYMVARDWARCSLPKVSNFDDMKPGDIICYSPHHVAIYIGGGTMIDASSSNGKVVQRSCDTSYWRAHFICARRVF